MVNNSLQLDMIFHSLADPTRRDILRVVLAGEVMVSELVERYDISFPAVSKHLKVLENAKLIRKQKKGRAHMVTLAPGALEEADKYLEQYRTIWQSRHDKLEALLNKGDEGYGKN